MHSSGRSVRTQVGMSKFREELVPLGKGRKEQAELSAELTGAGKGTSAGTGEGTGGCVWSRT